MKRKSKIVALILSLAMCLSLLAACGDKSDTSAGTSAPPSGNTGGSAGTGTAAPPSVAPGSGNTSGNSGQALEEPAPVEPEIRFAEHLDVNTDTNAIGTLNPFAPPANNTSTNWTFIMIYDRLVFRNLEGSYDPELATEWHTDDYKTYTFKLRDDVVFHNGDKFTADDVIWTVEAARQGVGSAAYENWRPVETVRAIDPYTVEFVLSSVNVDFLANLSAPYCGIVNKRAMTEDPELGTVVGTGAFSVTDFSPNNYVKVARNDNYWGEIPITKTMTLMFIPEIGTRAIMMQNGEIQISFGIGAEDIYLFQQDSEHFDVFPQIMGNPQCLQFVMIDKFGSDRNFRMAVMHAIDRAEIAKVAAGDWAAPETQGTLWGYATEFRNNDIPIIPYDLDLAKDYLEKSIYKGEEIEISGGGTTNIAAAEILQIQLAKIGIKSWINGFDTPGFGAYANSPEFASTLILTPYMTSLSASSLRSAFHPDSSTNRCKYNNPVITQMFDEAGTITDYETRKAHYMKIQEIIAEDPPGVNIFWRLNGIVSAKGVGGVSIPPDHHRTDLRYAYMVIEG